MTGPALAKPCGNLRITAVAPNELLMLQLGAARGDAYSRYVAEVAIATVLKVNSAPESRPAQCVCCRDAIWPGERYWIVVALHSVELTPEAGALLCSGCGVTPVTMVAAMRGLVPPDRTSGDDRA
jgi:hypothetical protein